MVAWGNGAKGSSVPVAISVLKTWFIGVKGAACGFSCAGVCLDSERWKA